MPLRTKLYVAITMLLAASVFAWSLQFQTSNWLLFYFLLVLVLLSSGLKIALPRGDSGMSLNFPFIFLAILRLAPEQALLLGAISMAAQCRIRVKKTLTPLQITFNIASTVLASGAALFMFLFARRHGLAVSLALSLAAVAYFLSSTASVALVIASAMKEPPYPLWKREFPWYLPFYFVGAALAVVTDMVGNRFGWQTALLLIPLVYTVFGAYNAQIIRLREREQHLRDTEALHLRTIEGLSMAIEAKDQNTHEHLFRVRDYVQEMGRTLNLNEGEMQALHTAAFLHDIGKLAVPEQIINKPGKLTPDEFEKMKIHPIVGADILERVQFPYPVVPIVRSHHEWWDGTGYPDGLKGEGIPLGARILSTADCFDALVSDRPYRKGLPIPEALALIKKMSGTQFDPQIVTLLIDLHGRRVEKESASTASTFSALKTDIEVVRGEAPAAGFEEGARHAAAPACPKVAEENEMDAMLLQRIGQASNEVHSLCQTSRACEGALTLSDVLRLWAARLRPLLKFDTCALFLYPQGRLTLRHVDGYDAECFLGEAWTGSDGISSWVAENGKPLLNGDVELESGYRSSLQKQDRLKAALSVPLLDEEGLLLGVLTLYSVRANSFYTHDLSLLTAISRRTALLLQDSLERSSARPAGSVGTSFLPEDGSQAKEPMLEAHAPMVRRDAVLTQAFYHDAMLASGPEYEVASVA